MNKKLKIKIIIIIFILITIIKIVQINFIENIRIEIEKFQRLNNSYYNVSSSIKNQNIEITIIRKGKIIKEVDDFIPIDNATVKYIDFNNMQVINIDRFNKTYEIKNNIENYDINIKNSPKILELLNEIKQDINNGNVFSIFNCFRIIYIIPIQYKDINCYKIKTTREVLYINKDTLYPVYLEYNQTNSNNKKEKIKIEYIFKENTVTDEDIKIPDLSNYKLVEN